MDPLCSVVNVIIKVDTDTQAHTSDNQHFLYTDAARRFPKLQEGLTVSNGAGCHGCTVGCVMLSSRPGILPGPPCRDMMMQSHRRRSLVANDEPCPSRRFVPRSRRGIAGLNCIASVWETHDAPSVPHLQARWERRFQVGK